MIKRELARAAQVLIISLFSLCCLAAIPKAYAYTEMNEIKLPSSMFNNVEEMEEVKNTYYTHILDYSYYDMEIPTYIESVNDLVEVYEYMLKNQQEELTLTVDPSPYYYNIKDNLNLASIDAYSIAKANMPEFAVYFDLYAPSAAEKPTAVDEEHQFKIEYYFKIGVKNDYDSIEKVKEEVKSAENEVASIIKGLYRSGELKLTMTPKEKALVLFKYVDLRLEYDTSYTIRTLSDTLRYNTAVCEGYTCLYNMLCHLAGVNVTGCLGRAGSDNGSHIWSKIYEDGTWYYIDTTWGDPFHDRPNYYDTKWFWQTWDNFPDHTLDKYDDAQNTYYISKYVNKAA